MNLASFNEKLKGKGGKKPTMNLQGEQTKKKKSTEERENVKEQRKRRINYGKMEDPLTLQSHTYTIQ